MRPVSRLITLILLVILVGVPRSIVFAAPISEQSDSSVTNPLQLPTIGYNSPVSATVGTPGDEDGFQFTATLGNIYVVELFNVSPSLGQGRSGPYQCGNEGTYTSYHTGMAIFIKDIATDSVVASRCDPNGSGNTFVTVTFKAVSNGLYTIRVYDQNSTVIGPYNLRVLPRFGETGASWDDATFEPNGSEANAYKIGVGREQAITTKVEQRDSIYATYSGDVDWYRFDAQANNTYVLEVFNVSPTLRQGVSGPYQCSNEGSYTSSHTGMALFVKDTATDSVVTGRCNPNGSNDALVSIAFKAATTGVHTIQVYPQDWGTFGTYSLRILPRYGELGASWDDTTFEPNNREPNAYIMSVGSAKAITSKIEQRNSIYGTYSGDNDWYRFDAQVNTTYIVEVFNVSPSISQGVSGPYQCGNEGSYTSSHTGMALFVKDTATDSVVASRCNPNGTGNVLVRVTFKVANAGIHTILVYPQDWGTFGSYSLRIRPEGEGFGVFLPLVQK